MATPGLHARLADAAIPAASLLRCDRCGAEEALRGRGGDFLRHGWPLCCRETMRLVTSREQSHPTGAAP